MAILEYEIGGNELKIDASEGISNIPDNRSMIVEHLTSEEPIQPEAVFGLNTIESVFTHFKPNVDVEFEDEEGQAVKENLRFGSVADFSIKKMTQQSEFLNKLSQEKDFYEGLVKQLRSNKVLQKAMQDSETKSAFISALEYLRKELETE